MTRTASSSQARASDQERLISGLARIGVVESVDGALSTVRFSDELTSPPLQWIGRAGKIALWAPPSEGDQVLVIAPEGDIEQAVILGSLFSDANPPVGSALALVLKWLEGAELTYDAETHDLTLVVPGKVTVKAEDGFLFEGDMVVQGAVRIEGDVDLQGKLNATGDVVGDGVSLKTHKHLGVQTGTGLTGAPQ